MGLKIEYRVTGGGGGFTVLADEGDGADTTAPRVFAYLPKYSKTPQVSAMFQAAFKQVADIGNGVWSFGFQITRTFASSGLARKHVSDQAAVFAAIQTNDIKITDGAVVLTFGGAALVNLQPIPDNDLTVVLAYEFTAQSYS